MTFTRRSDPRSASRVGEMKREVMACLESSTLSEEAGVAGNADVDVKSPVVKWKSTGLSSPIAMALTIVLFPNRDALSKYSMLDWLCLYRKDWVEDEFHSRGSARASSADAWASMVWSSPRPTSLKPTASMPA